MENKGTRFLAFDSLKGLKEAIEDVDLLTTKKNYPSIKEDKRDMMDNMLYKSYLHKCLLNIEYVHHGRCRKITDYIIRLDAIRHRIEVSGGRIIYLAEVTDLEFTEDDFEY